jgi:hypothetical protein
MYCRRLVYSKSARRLCSSRLETPSHFRFCGAHDVPDAENTPAVFAHIFLDACMHGRNGKVIKAPVILIVTGGLLNANCGAKGYLVSCVYINIEMPAISIYNDKVYKIKEEKT